MSGCDPKIRSTCSTTAPREAAGKYKQCEGMLRRLALAKHLDCPKKRRPISCLVSSAPNAASSRCVFPGVRASSHAVTCRGILGVIQHRSEWSANGFIHCTSGLTKSPYTIDIPCVRQRDGGALLGSSTSTLGHHLPRHRWARRYTVGFCSDEGCQEDVRAVSPRIERM